MIINSTTLVTLCAKMAALSSNQAGLTNDDFLSFANLETTNLSAELLQAREEYLIYQDSIPVAALQTAVRIPYRSINGTVRHLWWEDAGGMRTRIDRKTIEDMENYTTASHGKPVGFYLLGNSIVLLPTTDTAGTLVVAYGFRPNMLVDGSTCQTILTVSPDGMSVTVPNIPVSWNSGIQFDIIDNLSGNGVVHYDKLGNYSEQTITFTTPVPNAAAGHYIALAGMTPVPNLPEEGHSLLLEMTLLRLEIIRGNPNRIKAQTALVQNARKSWDLLLLNRVVSKAPTAGSGGAQFPLRRW